MTRKPLMILMIALLLALGSTAMAHRYQRSEDGNPLRLIGYIMHPIGVALEFAIFRPMHELASQPNWDIWLGHQPNLQDQDTYYEWTHGDFEPSIAAEIEADADEDIQTRQEAQEMEQDDDDDQE